MKVIDISAWQENVDWDAVVAEGIEGVILKIGERSTHIVTHQHSDCLRHQ